VSVVEALPVAPDAEDLPDVEATMAIRTYGPQSRGMVVCTLVLLTMLGIYSAMYDAAGWMWLVWSLLAIVTGFLLASDPGV